VGKILIFRTLVALVTMGALLAAPTGVLQSAVASGCGLAA
jgi:hypothetical protein